LQRARALAGRIGILLAPTGEGDSRSAQPVDLTRRARRLLDRLLTREGLEHLLPVGVCALLVVAALASSVPVARTASAAAQPTFHAATSFAPGGSAPRAVYGAGDGSAADETNDLYFGDGSILNIMQNASGGTDARSLLTAYTVQAGDTLSKIASRYGLATTTVYWANSSSLPDPTRLKIGQTLVIPPMDGLIVKVGANVTLDSLATKYKVSTQDIVDANNLPEPALVLGENVIIPGASGGPMPQPKKTTVSSTPVGGWRWPVGGSSYVSQYYWSGHHAIDIAAAMGTPVIAAASGKVVMAGWRSYTGGGNVIWVQDGAKLYTTYNHLSSWSVKVGQTIRAGQVIGRVGMTGVATGPHLHFEVWLGMPWALGNNSDAVNPCRYLAGC
jgi:murein DD-endopeptidase MepM/ murein hydrolase activator NlpD